MTTESVEVRPAAARRRHLALERPAWLTGTVLLVLGCLGLAGLSLLRPSTPTYDPWAWLIWGREVVHLDLSTVGGPSWKPLPVLFTAPFSLLGDAAPDLWLVIARAGGLLALAMAFRLGRRLAGGPWGWVAGVTAALALLTSTGYIRAVWPGNSEGLLIALLLWAIDSHLRGRRERAFLLGAFAALLRPETWPFLGLYGLWLAWREPRTRRLVIGTVLAVLALWFLPELWGSGQLLRAAERANNPDPQSPAFAAHPAQEVVKRYGAAISWPVFGLAGLGVGAALVRVGKDAVMVWLVIGAGAWLGLVALMTQAGYSGNPRYLMPVTAIACVLAGVGVGRVMESFAGLLRARRPVLPDRATPVSPGVSGSASVRAAIGLALVIVVGVAAYDRPQLDADLIGLRIEAHLGDQLDGAVARAGGAKAVLACGEPFTGAYQVPALAWRLDVHTIRVGLLPHPPAVVFRADRSARMPAVPAQPPYRLLASSGRWHVYGDCR
jgi:hypothetical protein